MLHFLKVLSMDAFRLFKNYKKIKLNIRGKGTHYLWVADTPRKKSLGLSKIKKLPKNHGMIFVYEEDVDHSFTMKNTRIPLKIIFLDANYDVAYSCRPFEKRSIVPKNKYRYVVEI